MGSGLSACGVWTLRCTRHTRRWRREETTRSTKMWDTLLVFYLSITNMGVSLYQILKQYCVTFSIIIFWFFFFFLFPVLISCCQIFLWSALVKPEQGFSGHFATFCTAVNVVFGRPDRPASYENVLRNRRKVDDENKKCTFWSHRLDR